PNGPDQVALRVQRGGDPGQAAGVAGRIVHHVPPRMAQGLARVRDRLVYVVADLDLPGGPARDLRVVGGYQGDRLPLVAHHVDGQHRLIGDLQAVVLAAGNVLVREHRVHAGRGQGRADVDRHDPGV